jgi:aryl-alcohol dehydrogenase-like predicted oxidoreductase
MEVARTKKLASFVAAQDEYNPLTRGIETSLVPVIERFGLALVPYFPLASGLLTDKYRKGQPMPTGTRLSGPPVFGAVRKRAEFRSRRTARGVLCGTRPDGA